MCLKVLGQAIPLYYTLEVVKHFIILEKSGNMLGPPQYLDIYCILKTGYAPSSIGFLHHDLLPLH